MIDTNEEEKEEVKEMKERHEGTKEGEWENETDENDDKSRNMIKLVHKKTRMIDTFEEVRERRKE